MFGIFGKKKSSAIPEDLKAALERHSYPEMSEALLRWCSSAQSFDEDLLLRTAKINGWSDSEQHKILIFALYYLKDYRRAFSLSGEFVSNKENFDVDIYILCIGILYRLAQFEDAARVLAAQPSSSPEFQNRLDYWVSRHLVFLSMNDMKEAEAALDKAMSLCPNDLGMAERSLSVFWEVGALDKFYNSLNLIEEHPPAGGYSYALNLLAMGRYREGFARMESRYEIEEAGMYLNSALLPLPRWDGKSIPKKCLLVSGEQGFGDHIQMARYLPMLKQKMGDTPFVIEVISEAVSLLETNFPELTITHRELGKKPQVDFDCWIGMMSLPHIFDTDISTVPAREGYLTVPEDARAYWKERMSELVQGTRARIGVTWSGQPAHRADRRRSVPFSKMVEAMKGFDADFFVLQKSAPAIRPSNLVDVSEELLTFSDTAALIQELDLVVTVDTSVVHLAGALGKQALLLLPYRYEWRWGVEGEENPWYSSVRVCRQRKSGEWDEVLKDVFENKIPDMIYR